MKHNHDHEHASHQHSHAHDHRHGLAKNSLRLAFFLTIVILISQFVGGLLAHSLALISEAGHAVTDIFALGLAWFATAQAERPANARKTFGYHRVGILAALVNAVTLIAIALGILLEAIQRFRHPEIVQPLVMFITPVIAIGINLFISFVLQKESHSLNVRAAALHVFGDIGASVAVIIGGMVILLTGWTFVDPLLSVGIALLIVVGSWRILREATDILLEAVPRDLSLNNLVADMKRVEGVQNVHDLHVWTIASGMSALSSHVVIEDLPPSGSTSILNSLTTMLDEKYHISHATIQFECVNNEGICCASDGLYCRLEVTKNAGNGHKHGSAPEGASHGESGG